MKKIQPAEDMQPYIDIIIQLCESLSCDADEIEDVVNQLNMTEYWVENKMLDLCEDNDVMRKVLKVSFNEFIEGYDVTNNGGILPSCHECGESVGENEKYHEYEEDALIVCDDCHNYYKHDIGKTGG